jgi:hypothetical protein
MLKESCTRATSVIIVITSKCDGPNKSLQDTLHRGKGSTTCSRTKGLYFEDLKLEKEEEGKGGEW